MPKEKRHRTQWRDGVWWAAAGLFLLRRQIGAAAVGHFGGHADGFAQRGVGVDGFADVHRIRAHFNGQGNFANHVARVGADDAAAHDLVGGFVKQQFGKAFVAAVGNGAARGVPGEQAFFDLHALGLGLVFGQADPGDFGC